MSVITEAGVHPVANAGSPSEPETLFRVAIIGAGPAAFYAADYLLKCSQPTVCVDMFDRLPCPFGLVRMGVAPDHQKIKQVTRVFDRIASHERFRFFGNVEFGNHLRREDLEKHYHQVLLACGAQSDRSMGIAGETLQGSFSATEFVAWYNGHPDFRDRAFDLSQEQVGIVGVGNVAIDVARILCRTTDELAKTDIAEHALDALSRSQVKEVYLLGRRGPAQAAFTIPEVRELGQMAEAEPIVRPDEVLLAPEFLSGPDEEEGGVQRKVEILHEFAARAKQGKRRKLHLRFLVSPTEILDDGQGRVQAIRLVRNELKKDARGDIRAVSTGQTEELPVGLVFRSVGYLGVPLADIPFNHEKGTIPNVAGRVLEENTPIHGIYVTGWIKRGPSGVIGTNKPDAIETAECMLEDLRNHRRFHPDAVGAAEVEAFIRSKQPHCVSYADWKRIDAVEVAAGKSAGRPRIKFSSVEQMLNVLI